MTVTTEQNRIEYAGDGTTTAFPYPFKFLDKTDIDVWVNNVQKVYGPGGDYTVGTPSDTGANVTFAVAPASGSFIVIYRDPDLLQKTALPSNGPFPSDDVEGMSDKSTLQIQRINERINRSVRLNEGAPQSINTVLPDASANKAIGWNEMADGLRNYSASDFATIVGAGNPQFQYFSGDGVTKTFTLQSDPVALANLDISISGITKGAEVNYELANQQVTFDVAPPVGVSNIFMRWTTGVPVPVGGVPDFSITTNKLADLSVTTPKIADLSVTTPKLADASVTNDKILNGTISVDKLSPIAISLIGADNTIQGFRMTLDPNNPAPPLGLTSNYVYFKPYISNIISLWNGQYWEYYRHPDISPILQFDVGPSAGNTNYDIFIYLTGPTVAFQKVAWISDNTRVALVRRDGVLCKADDKTKRYIGTIRTDPSGSTISDSLVKNFLWNLDNRLVGSMSYLEPAIRERSTTSGLPALDRKWNGNNNAYIQVIHGMVDSMQLTVQSTIRLVTGTNNVGGSVYMKFNGNGGSFNVGTSSRNYRYSAGGSAISTTNNLSFQPIVHAVEGLNTFEFWEYFSAIPSNPGGDLVSHDDSAAYLNHRY
jgi:hypothetical protein